MNSDDINKELYRKNKERFKKRNIKNRKKFINLHMMLPLKGIKHKK